MTSAVSPTAYNEVQGLTEAQIAKVNELKEEIKRDPSIAESHKKWIETPNRYAHKRYLVAHKWDVANAMVALKKTLAWRDEVKPELIQTEHLFKENPERKGVIRHSGFDKEGRPLIIYSHQKFTEQDLKDYIHWAIAGAEAVFKLCKPGNHLAHLVYDLTDMSWDNLQPLSWHKEIQHIFASHYPESTKIAWVYKQPFIFNIFYTMLSPFLDDNQRSKVKMIGSDSSKLLEHFEPHQLPVQFGGTLKDEFVGKYSNTNFADSNIN